MLIYLCEDCREEVTDLQACLAKAAAELSAGCTINTYLSGETLLRAVEQGGRPSLAVLDIYLEGMSGIETGQRLRTLLPDLPLAFLTNSREFAVDAFELNALHYIVKPLTTAAARTLLERLPAHTAASARLLELPAPGETAIFTRAEIIRIVSKSRGVELHFLNRSAAWLSCPFREAAARLAEDPDFLLLSRGCIVNLNNVHGIDFDTCYLKNGEQLPVSRREHPNVKKHYNDFLFRKMDQRKDGAI